MHPAPQVVFTTDRSKAVVWCLFVFFLFFVVVVFCFFFFIFFFFCFFFSDRVAALCFSSRKYIIMTPLKPHFYIVKLGFTGVYIIPFISAQKHRLWVLVRTASPRRF